MGKQVKKSRLSEIPAWALSILTLVSLFVLVFILNKYQLLEYKTVEIGFYIFVVFYFPAACYYICKAHPKSVWYTPLICNSVSILVASFYSYTNPEFLMLVFMGSVFIFSVIASIVGARKGKRIIEHAN